MYISVVEVLLIALIVFIVGPLLAVSLLPDPHAQLY